MRLLGICDVSTLLLPAFAALALSLGVAVAADPGSDKPAKDSKESTDKTASDKSFKENKPADKSKPGSNGKEGNKDKEATRGKLAGNMTPEREAAVMTFVERNHPQLRDLLTQLKMSQPKEYERALRELFRVTERLATIQEKDPKQHALELQAWTLQSRNQLIAARLRMARDKRKPGESSDDMPPSELQHREELEAELEGILGQQIDVRMEIMAYERAKAQQRLEKLDKEISDLKTNRNQTVSNQMQQITGRKGKGKGGANKPNAPSADSKKPKPNSVPTSTNNSDGVK